MARRAVPKKSAARKRAKPANGEQVTVAIAMDIEDAMEPAYVNHAEVSQTVFDCGIDFARLPTKLSLEQSSNIKENGLLKVQPSVRIVMPKGLMPGLIAALQTEWEKANKND